MFVVEKNTFLTKNHPIFLSGLLPANCQVSVGCMAELCTKIDVETVVDQVAKQCGGDEKLKKCAVRASEDPGR